MLLYTLSVSFGFLSLQYAQQNLTKCCLIFLYFINRHTHTHTLSNIWAFSNIWGSFQLTLLYFALQMYLVIFPEGTRYNPELKNVITSSQEFASKEGMQIWKKLLFYPLCNLLKCPLRVSWFTVTSTANDDFHLVHTFIHWCKCNYPFLSHLKYFLGTDLGLRQLITGILPNVRQHAFNLLYHNKLVI